jgi:hypothetical protein
MTVEGLKIVFDWAAVILLLLTFATGVGGLITGSIINGRQAEHLRQFERDLTTAKTALADREADNLDLRLAMQPRRLHTRRTGAESDLGLKPFSGMFVRVQSSSDSEPSTLASDIRAALGVAGIVPNAPQDSWFTVGSKIRPAIEVWTADPTMPGMLPNIKALADKSSRLRDELVVWLRSNGLHSIERRFNPHSQAEFMESPWESNLVPVDQVAVIVGAKDVNREVEILRAARKPAVCK